MAHRDQFHDSPGLQAGGLAIRILTLNRSAGFTDTVGRSAEKYPEPKLTSGFASHGGPFSSPFVHKLPKSEGDNSVVNIDID